MRAQTRVLGGELVDVHGVEGAEHLGVADVDAQLDRASAHLDRLAQDGQVGDAAREHGGSGAQHPIVVALGQHDAAAIGAGAVDEAVLEHQRGDDARARDAQLARQELGVDVPLEQGERRVVAVLRVGGEATAGVHDAHRGVVGAEVGGDDGQRRAQTVDQADDGVGQLEAAVEHDARERGERARGVGEQRREQHLGTVGGDHHDRGLLQARQHVDHRHARDDDAEHLAREQRRVALDQLALDRAQHAAHRGGDEEAVLGKSPHRHGAPLCPDERSGVDHLADGCHDLVEVIGIRAIGDDGEERRALVLQLGDRERGDLADLLRRAGHRQAERLAVALLRPAAEHEQHGSAEVGRDAGVVRQLGGAADVGVVAADDDHGVAPRLDRLVPLDDARQGGVGVVAHVVVGDAHAVVVSEVDAVVVEQHLEHVVAFGRGARDGAEHPRARRHAAEGVEDAQSHGGFARMTFGRRDVDALRHPISLLRGPDIASGLLRRRVIGTPRV